MMLLYVFDDSAQVRDSRTLIEQQLHDNRDCILLLCVFRAGRCVLLSCGSTKQLMFVREKPRLYLSVRLIIVPDDLLSPLAVQK